MAYLGKLTKRGVTSATNPVLAGGWTITFDPAALGVKIGAEVYHIAVQGPENSRFQVWIDTTFYSNVVRGDINDWDPAQPMYIRPGDTVFFYYNTAAGTAPVATVFLREPLPL